MLGDRVGVAGGVAGGVAPQARLGGADDSRVDSASCRGLPWTLAREWAHAAAAPVGTVTVPLREAAGLALAQDLVAPTPLPGFDTAAMDGFAVAGDGPWRLVGESLLGSPWSGGALESGSAARIATGALVPRGAHAVLPVEQSRVEAGLLTGPALPEGKHVRRTGEDAQPGTRLVKAGTLARPSLLGLAATCGHDTLRVHRRPRVRVIVTGGELVHTGIAPPGHVRDALGPLLHPLLQQWGAEVTATLHAPDHPRSALIEAVTGATDTEVVVVAGSTSVGVTDGLRSFLLAHNADWIVDTVACRPGHPQLLARLPSGPYVVGLPGNPFAALVAAYTMLQPLLEGLTGRPLGRLPRAPLAEPVDTPPDRTRIVPAAWDGPALRPLGGSRPAFLNGAAIGDALAVIAPATPPEAAVPFMNLA